ncbi:hypothetical protein AWB74_07710 [Caballeronia arvi]|uniref:Uncharacterized protein n=1 Tax=Caballeronia arvi TaxID=1777135 RepID=A0A158KZ86_9BURK|nr:hypothetical protein AWB74_07710 [Caballeronia arvi]
MVTAWAACGELKTPDDLAKKLAFDLARMRDPGQRLYAAFDFFVTTEHVVDWLHPNDNDADKANRSALRQSSILLQVVSHLANGGKHFQVTHKSTSLLPTCRRWAMWYRTMFKTTTLKPDSSSRFQSLKRKNFESKW